MKVIRDSVWKQPCADGFPPSSCKWSHWNDTIQFGNDYIVFNTLSGAVVVLSEYEHAGRLPVSLHPSLLKLGILVPVAADEPSDWLAGYEKAKVDMSSLDLTIATTMQCQLGCVYCFEGTGNREGILDDDVMRHIEQFVERCDNLKTLRVTWFGGEPLLNVKAITGLSTFFVDYCARNGIDYMADMTTNGYALTPQLCHTLIEECNVKRYIITIDGTRDVHNRRRRLRGGGGTFDVIWKNVLALVDAGAFVTVRMTIDRENADRVFEFIDMLAASEVAGRVGLAFAKTVGLSSTPQAAQVHIMTDEEYAKREIEFIRYAHDKGLLRYTTPRPCPLGGCLRSGDIVIGAAGETYKCLDTIGEREWVAGSVCRETNVQVEPEWYGRWLSWNPFKSNQCKDCRLLPLCNGGCPHNALFASKKHGVEHQCPDWKANYEKRMKLYVEEKLNAHEYKEI